MVKMGQDFNFKLESINSLNGLLGKTEPSSWSIGLTYRIGLILTMFYLTGSSISAFVVIKTLLLMVAFRF